MKNFDLVTADLLTAMGAETGVVKLVSGDMTSDSVVVRVVAVEDGLDTATDSFDGYELTLDITGDTFEITDGGDEPAYFSAPYQTLVAWTFGLEG